jgi:hypothetical protein
MISGSRSRLLLAAALVAIAVPAHSSPREHLRVGAADDPVPNRGQGAPAPARIYVDGRGVLRPSRPPADVASKLVGTVLSFDEERKEARISFGRDAGAMVGGFLRIESAERKRFLLEITRVGASQSVARVLEAAERRSEQHGELVHVSDDIPRTGDEIRLITAQPAPEKHYRPEDLDDAKTLKAIANERVEAARLSFAISRAYLEYGSIDLHPYSEVSQDLMEAERDANAGVDGEIAALQGHLARLTYVVDHMANDFRLCGPPPLDDGRYLQIQAALSLAEAKRKARAR